MLAILAKRSILAVRQFSEDVFGLYFILNFSFARAYEEREHYTDIYTTRALVTDKGHVLWNNGVLWQISCKVEAMWFPLDRQVLRSLMPLASIWHKW